FVDYATPLPQIVSGHAEIGVLPPIPATSRNNWFGPGRPSWTRVARLRSVTANLSREQREVKLRARRRRESFTPPRSYGFGTGSLSLRRRHGKAGPLRRRRDRRDRSDLQGGDGSAPPAPRPRLVRGGEGASARAPRMARRLGVATLEGTNRVMAGAPPKRRGALVFGPGAHPRGRAPTPRSCACALGSGRTVPRCRRPGDPPVVAHRT